MKVRVRGLRLSLDQSENDLIQLAARRLGLNKKKITGL